MSATTLRDRLVGARENERLSARLIEPMAEWLSALAEQRDTLQSLVESMSDRASDAENFLSLLTEWAESDDRESKADARESALDALADFLDRCDAVDADELEAHDVLVSIIDENAAALADGGAS